MERGGVPDAAADQADERVSGGLAELDRWLLNRVRIGLGNTFDDTEAAEFIADRLSAADLPILAARIDDAEELRARGDIRRLLAEYGALHLVATSWERRATLPGPLYATLRCRLGLSVPSGAEPVDDLWQVLASEAYGPVWALGAASGRYAKLDEVPTKDPERVMVRVGESFVAALAFHEEAVPLCGRVSGTAYVERRREPPPGSDFAALLGEFRAAVAADPWTGGFPATIDGATISRLDDGWFIADRHGEALPLLARSQATAVSSLWRLAAASVGNGNGNGIWNGNGDEDEAEVADGDGTGTAATGRALTVFGFLTAEGFVAVTAWPADGKAIQL